MEGVLGAEKEREPGHHGKDHTHVVQATDAAGRIVSRDPFDSQDAADARAAQLTAQGHTVEVSRLQPASPARN